MTRRHRVLGILIAVAALVLVLRAASKKAGVLEDNRVFAGHVISGQVPYFDGLHTPYPPSYGIVMSPLLLLPLTASRVAWALLQLAFLALLLWKLWRWYLLAGPPRTFALAVACGLLLASRYLLRDMKGGGANLVFGTLVLLACFRPGEPPGTDRGAWRGIGLGIVLAAKPTPLFFLPWLAFRGRWRTLAVALASALVLHASPLLTLGWDGWCRAYARWGEATWLFMTQADVFADPAYGIPDFTWMNQALRCALGRYLGTVPESYAALVPHFFQGLGLEVATVAACARAASATLVGLTLWILFRTRKSADARADLLALTLLVALTLLLSPITWKAHHVQLLPAFFGLVALGVPWPRLAIYALACTFLSYEVVGDRYGEMLQSWYLVTAGALWIWCESYARLRSLKNGTPSR